MPDILLQWFEQYTMDVKSFRSCKYLGTVKIYEAHRFCNTLPNLLITSISFDLLWIIIHHINSILY